MPAFLHDGIMPNLLGNYYVFMFDQYCENFYGPDYISIINKRFADEVFDKAVVEFVTKTIQPRVSDFSTLRTFFDELNLPCTYSSIVCHTEPVYSFVERAVVAFNVFEAKQVRRRELEVDLVKYDDIGLVSLLVSWAFSKSDVVANYISDGYLPKRSQLPGTLYLKYYREILRKDRVGIYDLIGQLPSFNSQKRKIEKFIEGVGYRNYDLIQFVNMLKEDAFFKENHEKIVVKVSTSNPKYPKDGFNESVWESVFLQDTIERETRHVLVIKGLTDWVAQNLTLIGLLKIQCV